MLRSEKSMWCLGDRFILAHRFANALLELQSVSWLHCNIIASNIAFFHQEKGDTIYPKQFKQFKQFHFVGFAQSRSKRELTDSDGCTSGAWDETYY